MLRSTYESVRIDRFVFGSTRRSIRLRQSNRTAKVRLRFRRRTFTCAEPNAYVTYKLYKLYLSQRSARSIDLACAKDFILNKEKRNGGKRGMCLFFLFRNNLIYLSEMRKKKKESILDVHTRFKPTETFQYRLYQRRRLKTSQNKIFKNNI